MAHLAATRKGWQNEHLALFMLSKLAFCANPVTISDDLGSDFFCCLFDTRRRGKADVVLPLTSFAVQIKSSVSDVDVSNKLEYLGSLELPFFVGVIDQQKLKLTLYSGEYLPILFSEVVVKKLKISLRNHGVTIRNYKEEIAANEYRVFFPKVAVLRAAASKGQIRVLVQCLSTLCRRIYGNISARRSEEHIYSLSNTNRVCIMAGPGSNKCFRQNFYRRLAEAFYNFYWILSAKPQDFDPGEVAIYRDLFLRLRKRELPVPRFVTHIEAKLKILMKQKGVDTGRP